MWGRGKQRTQRATAQNLGHFTPRTQDRVQHVAQIRSQRAVRNEAHGSRSLLICRCCACTTGPPTHLLRQLPCLFSALQPWITHRAQITGARRSLCSLHLRSSMPTRVTPSCILRHGAAAGRGKGAAALQLPAGHRETDGVHSLVKRPLGLGAPCNLRIGKSETPSASSKTVWWIAGLSGRGESVAGLGHSLAPWQMFRRLGPRAARRPS